MFGFKKEELEQLRAKNTDLAEKNSTLRKMIDDQSKEVAILKEKLTRDAAVLKEKLETKADRNEEEFKSRNRILESEFNTKIVERTQEMNAEINRLCSANSVLKERNTILEQAFKNMGFDVKDMKSILDKLVEGIVGKNTVNVIK